MTASTTCQTDVGILPNDVITSGFIPSDMIACKAGQRSRRRTHRANADSEPDSDSSAQASSLSIAVYNVTNRAENENTLYHYISSLIFLLNVTYEIFNLIKFLYFELGININNIL